MAFKTAGVVAVCLIAVIQGSFMLWHWCNNRAEKHQAIPHHNFLCSTCSRPFIAQQMVPMVNISEDLHVPCIVHRTVPNFTAMAALSDERYDKYYGSWARLLPPYCHQYFWTDDNMAQLVEHFVPEAVEEYNWLKSLVEKSDFVRITALYGFGGVYADNDVELCLPLHQWSMNETGIGMIVGIEECFRTKKPCTYSQYFMAAAPRHPAVKAILELIITNIITERTTGHSTYEKLDKRQQILSRTGPRAVTKALEEYLRPYNTSLSWLCETRKPYHVPNTDILILPRASIKSRRCGQHPGLTLIVHSFERNWEKLLRNNK